jgi:hypothetical protein
VAVSTTSSTGTLPPPPYTRLLVHVAEGPLPASVQVGIEADGSFRITFGE